MREPILITGAARSGTSMVAGIINMSGAFGGKMSGSNQNNQKGMFENSRIRNSIIKPYLEALNLDPKGQYPLPDPYNIPTPDDWCKQIEQVMIDQGYEGDKPWMYKGAKICLMWTVWAHTFPNAKVIVVRRRTADIVNSCIKTGFMSAFNDSKKRREVSAETQKEGWLWWVHQHQKRFIEMKQTLGDRIMFVWPERMLYGDYSQMYEMVEWLGLEWAGQKVYDFIEPKLWHTRRKMKGAKKWR